MTHGELLQDAETLAELVTKADADAVAAEIAYLAATTAYEERTANLVLGEKQQGEKFAMAWAFINSGAEREAMHKAHVTRCEASIRFHDLNRRFKIALARAQRRDAT